MRVDCPLIISSSLIWQCVWTFPASRRSHCARLFPPLIFCVWPIPFQRENLNVNLNFHHLIFCWAPLYHGLMAVDEAANKGASKSCTNGAGLLSALEHVYVKKSWRVTSTSLICCYSNIHFGWWCMYIVQQKSWLGWLNNIHIPVSTHNKVVEKIRFLSLDSFRCVQTRRSVIFHLKLSVVFQMSNETRSLCQSPHRRTCVKKLKKFIRAKKFQISRGEISNVENYLSHQM
jgi:hypothetical protein